MAAEKKTATPTSYVILKKVVSGDGYMVVNQGVLASSAEQAIRSQVLLIEGEKSGTFVAVPERSWRPTKVAPKTTVQLELTEVKP